MPVPPTAVSKEKSSKNLIFDIFDMFDIIKKGFSDVFYNHEERWMAAGWI